MTSGDKFVFSVFSVFLYVNTQVSLVFIMVSISESVLVSNWCIDSE